MKASSRCAILTVATLVLLTTGCDQPIEVMNYQFTPMVVAVTRTTPVVFEANIQGAPTSVVVRLSSNGTEGRPHIRAAGIPALVGPGFSTLLVYLIGIRWAPGGGSRIPVCDEYHGGM